MEKRLFKKELQIPFITVTQEYNRDLMKYVDVDDYYRYLGYPEYSCNIADNKIFKEHLNFTHFSRGRSSVKAHFKSMLTGNEYEMFISDMEELINLEYSMTSLKGYFCFRKQGKNFGITLIHDMEDKDVSEG